MSTLYLCGAGNVEGIRLALTIQRAESRWDRIVVLDDDPAKHGQSILGLVVAGPFSMLEQGDAEHDFVVNLVTRKTSSRWAVMEKIAACGIPFASLVHPSVDTFGTELANGVTIYQSVILGAGCRVDAGSVVLVRAVVGHGSRVGKGCVIAPGAVLNARVTLGDRAYFGTNATILPDLRVGEDATVASLSSVIDDVPNGATAMGVPAEILLSERNESPDLTQQEIDPERLKTISKIWQSVLRKKSVKPDDNFFDLGGSSLLVFKVRNALQDTLGIQVSPVDMFRFLTVRSLAAHLARLEKGVMPGAEPQSEARHSRRREFFAARQKQRRA